MKKTAKRILCAVLCLSALLSLPCPSTFAAGGKRDVSADEFMSVARGIVDWKKSDLGTDDGYLICDSFLTLAGTTPGDWYPIGLARLGIEDNSDAYLAVIRDVVAERYKTPEKLSSVKATEWHRISLAVLAAGGDPTNMGTADDGSIIDLIADGTYNRGYAASLGKQGINGWIWGLIALDSMRYDVPDGAYYTRDDIIKEILCRQNPDGGFSLMGEVSDPDITAMALQALAPYKNSETVYVYTLKASGENAEKTVWEVINEAIDCLSALQLDTGDFESWGTENVESTDQVTVALCSLGIDPLSDSRFIKGENTLFDGIMRYRMADGGFVHSYTYDEENPTSLPDQSNTMAGEQTLYTMAALWRLYSGKRTLYDFRPEQSGAMRSRLSELDVRLAGITSETPKDELYAMLESYCSVPENERSYVNNYRILSDAAKTAGIDIEAVDKATETVESPADEKGESSEIRFTESDRAAADSLPDKLSTEQYVLVVTLTDKLQRCADFPEKEYYIEKLTAAKAAIAAVQTEIDSLNRDIKEKLYPFENLGLKDKKTVDETVSRYNALSPYDRKKVERYEDVIKSKTKIDNELRAIVICIVLCCIAAACAVFLVRRIKRRRRRREAEFEELCKKYADEDDE